MLSVCLIRNVHALCLFNTVFTEYIFIRILREEY